MIYMEWVSLYEGAMEPPFPHYRIMPFSIERRSEVVEGGRGKGTNEFWEENNVQNKIDLPVVLRDMSNSRKGKGNKATW